LSSTIDVPWLFAGDQRWDINAPELAV